MIVENDERDNIEVFLRLLLIGELYLPTDLKDKSAYFQDVLKTCGITLYNSEFSILDKSWVGNSLITVANYMLDYRYANDPTGRRTCVEGSVTTQLDERGSMHIRIRSTSSSPGLFYKTEEPRASSFGE